VKTEQDVLAAKDRVLRVATMGHELSDEQIVLLKGMVIALNWVLGSPNGSTLQELLDGRPIVAKGSTK